MIYLSRSTRALAALGVAMLSALSLCQARDEIKKTSEPPSKPAAPVKESFSALVARMEAAKPEVLKRQAALLEERYDLSDRPVAGVTMSGGKPVQGGVRARLPRGMTWEKLAVMTPDAIREKDLFPAGLLPLPHVNHPGGGMVLPNFAIDALKKEEGRNLARFDVEHEFPAHFLPEFPPPMYLTTRTDLGDVTKGKLVTLQNYAEIFDGILNPKQLDGLRLLLTPMPSQQFNSTEDRRTVHASLGVACFDCHANGHTVGGYALSPDMRPQASRIRIDTPTLRGVNLQRLFGSKRALKTVEDITEFEQRTAYFDGDPAAATKKGLGILERATQVQAMAEFQHILDLPPAPKLDLFGKLNPKKATQKEIRGEALFFGKAKCSVCHPAPYFTDNQMHNLQAERFYKPRMINGLLASSDGPIKTFPLRGIKDSPPYLHDGRLMTLEDTVEFFNLILELKLSKEEKEELTAFMRQL
jgi:cytochrome c peroxidase